MVEKGVACGVQKNGDHVKHIYRKHPVKNTETAIRVLRENWITINHIPVPLKVSTASRQKWLVPAC